MADTKTQSAPPAAASDQSEWISMPSLSGEYDHAAYPNIRSDEPIITVKEVFKSFQVGPQFVPVLKEITFDVERADFLIVFGPSGCGKSTLLHIILGLEGPSTGKMTFLGEDLYAPGRPEDYRSEFRKHHIGMVYQQSNWVKSLTVIENIAFPLLLLGWEKERALNRAKEALESVRLGGWADYHPMDLSSGQQQRIAIARAIITDPEVIIADEPTGNLDYEAGENLLKLLRSLNDSGKTIIMVTHDLEYLSYAKTALSMRDGKVLGMFRGAEKAELEKGIHSKRGVNPRDIAGTPDPEADFPETKSV